MSNNNHTHILKKPLVTYSNEPSGGIGVLPEGTRLYYDQSFPEGLDRYHVFINVEGGHLPITKLIPVDLVDPLTSFVVESTEQVQLTIEELTRLLHALGVKKSDVETLLATYE